MLFIHLSAILGAAVFVICYNGAEHKHDTFGRNHLFLLFLAALLTRLLAAALSKGFGTDTACFAAWAERIFQVGPGAFYSPDVFTDYPPGYMYVLWIIGAVRNFFQMGYYSVPHLILLKLPAILCDMICGLLLFGEASRKCSESQAFFLCAAYLFNPAIVLNSSVWGQVDSIYTLAILYMCLCLIRRKMYSAYIIFALGLLIKPQTLMFAPVLFAGIVDHVFLKNFSVRHLLHHLFQGLTAIGGMLILCLPFGLENVWKQYFSTVSSYPYAAVNACNLWGFFGLNWISQNNTFLGIPYYIWGFGAILAAVAATLYLSLRNSHDTEKYPFLGAFLLITVFVFSVRMHERYLYPALTLLLLAYVYKPAKMNYLMFTGFSILHFYNTADVLFFYDPASYDRKTPLILLVSAGMLLCAGLLFYTAHQFYRGRGSRQAGWQADSQSGRRPFQNGSQPVHKSTAQISGTETPQAAHSPSDKPRGSLSGAKPSFQVSRKEKTLGKADIFCMLIFTLIYACFALYDLGDRQAPASSLTVEPNQSLTLDFGSQVPAKLSYYIGPWHSSSFLLEGRNHPDAPWNNFGEITLKSVFTWQEVPIETNTTQIRLTLQSARSSTLFELNFQNALGERITPMNSQSYSPLFDEASLVPEEKTFRNSMYFDEIYHGRTAYEFIHGLTSYENTHPPLGKIFIALGVAAFGMNPFGWRIVGTIFGILMVPLVYLFARRITDKPLPAALACVLFTFDFMHFTQTRIATIDVYITFFVILMYYFMYRYSQLSFYDTPLWKTWLPLGACGVCMGLGVASKWTGVYAGIGLALIFFATLYRRFREYRIALAKPSGSTDSLSHKHIIECFAPHTRRTIYFCLVFFVAVPALIYLLSYLPFRDYSERGLWDRMIHNQETMFDYHSNLDSTHPYSSTWYEWPIIKRPIWYYSRIVTQTAEGGLREGISSFGNPAVWWPGILAAFYMIYLWAKHKDRTAAFLLVGYLAQYLPWFFVTRVTFIYHYFPSVVFVVLMIVHGLLQWNYMNGKEKTGQKSFLVLSVVYGLTVFGLFLLFYPVLAGQPVEASFVAKYLRWFSSWVLTSR